MRRLLFFCLMALAIALGMGERAYAERIAQERPPLVHGLAPLPHNAEVPIHDLPPGSTAGDRSPSHVIYPPEKLTIRFDHRRHDRLGLACLFCHPGAAKSRRSADSLQPQPALCDACHGSDHQNLDAVQNAGNRASGECGYCHLQYRPSDGNRVARMHLPAPNLHFDHALHHARNIACAQCHGAVQNVELATRQQLPRMRGCFQCHRLPEPARGAASGTCTTCHLMRAGRLQTRFEAGTLLPPRWLHNAGHGADWLERHKTVAAQDSKFCGNCHKEEECMECHDGRVRPRRVHPNDWLNLHAVAARQTPTCTSCHRQQSFCLGCHQRAGVTLSGPYANFAGRGQFHPPKSEWTDGPRGPRHHAWEAQRNLSACVSCHVERDCAGCHSSAAVGGPGAGLGFGRGVNPHPLGFQERCGAARRKNARSCLVCHGQADAMLERCR